jgi:hypothetical protein
LALHGVKGVADQVDQDLLEPRLVNFQMGVAEITLHACSPTLPAGLPSSCKAASTALLRLA